MIVIMTMVNGLIIIILILFTVYGGDNLVFVAAHVAKGIVRYSAEGYFGIGVGMEGFLLKHLHAGMSPVNNFTEVLYAVIIKAKKLT